MGAETARRCVTCDGYGTVDITVSIDHFSGYLTYACPDCDGEGWISGEATTSDEQQKASGDDGR